MIYLTLHFLNFLAVEHVEILIAANVVALHLIVILIFVMCLKKINQNAYIKKGKTIISLVYDKRFEIILTSENCLSTESIWNLGVSQ